MPVPSQERHRPVPRHMLQERPVMLSPVPLHCAHFPLECGSHSRQPPLSPRRSQEGISIYAFSPAPHVQAAKTTTAVPAIAFTRFVISTSRRGPYLSLPLRRPVTLFRCFKNCSNSPKKSVVFCGRSKSGLETKRPTASRTRNNDKDAGT